MIETQQNPSNKRYKNLPIGECSFQVSFCDPQFTSFQSERGKDQDDRGWSHLRPDQEEEEEEEDCLWPWGWWREARGSSVWFILDPLKGKILGFSKRYWKVKISIIVHWRLVRKEENQYYMWMGKNSDLWPQLCQKYWKSIKPKVKSKKYIIIQYLMVKVFSDDKQIHS